MHEIIGKIFIIVGLGFDILGCIGLLRLPDVYNRLQATTKCVTLGTCSILSGTFILRGYSATGMKAILAVIFLVMTSPVAAHALARGSHKSGVRLWKGSVVDKYEEEKSNEIS